MKKILLLAIVLLAVSSCINNNNRKAKKLIKEYLKESMNDYTSYEPMVFSKLDSVFSRYYQDSIYEDQQRRFDSNSEYIKNLETTIEKANNFNSRVGWIADRRGVASEGYLKEAKIENEKLSLAIKDFRKNYKPKMEGYTMYHKFRGNNAFNAKVINELIFFFNIDLTNIKYSMDADKYRELEKKISRSTEYDE